MHLAFGSTSQMQRSRNRSLRRAPNSALSSAPVTFGVDVQEKWGEKQLLDALFGNFVSAAEARAST